jgi:hypothetical protein
MTEQDILRMVKEAVTPPSGWDVPGGTYMLSAIELSKFAALIHTAALEQSATEIKGLKDEIADSQKAYEYIRDHSRDLDAMVAKLQAEIAELRGQVPKWISAKDRLPITPADMEGNCYENADGLFVLTGSSGVQRSDFAAGNTWGYWGKFSYERDVVTHWLEIQIPPQPTNNQSTLHAEGGK